MIKLIAAIIMLLDHVGFIMQSRPSLYFSLCVIGRIAMPLFAYTVARGYAYSKAHGTTVKYLRNLSVFSLISQLPYYLLRGAGTNIGVTWLLAVLVLINYEFLRERIALINQGCVRKQAVSAGSSSLLEKFLIVAPLLAILCLLVLAELIKVDFGTSAISLCFMFYLLEHKQTRSFGPYVLAVLLSCLIYLIVRNGSLIQIFAILSVPVLLMAQRWDNLICLPKWFFYLFYPAHMAILFSVSKLAH